MSVNEKCDVKYEFVAPDGGWGYMIILAAVINLVTTTGFLSSFGMIYNDFMIELGLGSTGLTLLNGINAMSFAVAGFFTSPLQKFMNMRQLTLVAVLLYIFGGLCMVFVKSVIPFYICVGIVQGSGLGIAFNLTYAMVNEYFVEKRLFAYSVMKTSIAIFLVFAPQFVKMTMSYYGFRGALIMILAVSLHSLIAVAVMQPVAWHMKKVAKQPLKEETRVLLIVEKNDEKEYKLELKDVKPIATEESKLENDNHKKSSWLVQKLNSLFDWALIKSLLLSNVSWSIALSAVADLTFVSLLPQALYSYNWSKDDVALALSLLGLGDLTGRASFIVISKWLNKVGGQEIFIAGIMISVIARVSILLSPSVTVSFVFITLYGVGRCFVAIFLPLVVTEVVGTEKFTAAMGFLMLMIGIMNLGGGPIIGAIRDYTQSYEITFWILAILLSISFVSWTIELVYKRRQRIKKEEE